MYILFVWTFTTSVIINSVSGATFTAIGNVVDSNIFLCGNEVVLTCSESSLVISMDFTVDGVQVAYCSFPHCEATNSSFAPNFSMNTTIGIFNFKLQAVKSSDDGRVFICDINGQKHQIIPKVVEIPQNQSLIIQNKTVQTGTEIKAITGCLFPTSAIHFEWYTVKVSDESIVLPFEATDNKTEPDNSLCVQLPDCQGSGMSNTFVIQESASSSRGEVFLEVRVWHEYSPNQLLSIKRTARSFIISDPVATTTTARPIQTTDTTTLSTTTYSSIETMSTNSQLETSITTAQTPGTTHKQNADATSTILIAAFSSMAGIIVLLIAVYALTKIRKRHKKHTDAKQMEVMNPEFNKQA